MNDISAVFSKNIQHLEISGGFGRILNHHLKDGGCHIIIQPHEMTRQLENVPPATRAKTGKKVKRYHA